ncbi:MAG: isoamylase early set domain-containing protein [Anaerolineae bacterium]|nr:isoamylase early set domain-containing protein [Anaerolineae bacterium]
MIRRKGIQNRDQVKVTFVLPGDHPYGKVAVVGDFNDWDNAVHKFVRRSNHTYSVAVTLNKGQRYAFRYQAENGTWFNDEAADAYEANEFGAKNCILLT